jgi:hypothetical protein
MKNQFLSSKMGTNSIFKFKIEQNIDFLEQNYAKNITFKPKLNKKIDFETKN